MRTRVNARAFAAAALAIAAMGCGSTAPVADGGFGDDAAADGGADPLSPIDPAAPPVRGEGDACRFSVECGPLQVCVDDACVRSERLDPATLTWGELRRTPLDEILAGAGASLPRPWSLLREGDVDPRPRSSIIASRAGATLAFTVDHPSSCPLVYVGANVRAAWIDDLRCTAMSLDERDAMWVAGLDFDTGSPVVVRVGDDGSEIARYDLAASLDAPIGAATSGRRLAGPVTSMLWFGGALYLSMRPGQLVDRFVSTETSAEIEVAFVRVDTDGSARLLDVGGTKIFAGSEAGWLVPNSDGSPSALLVQRDVTSFDPPVPLDLVRLSDGSRERWLDDWALDMRPSVWAPGVVDLLVKNEPPCAFTVLRPPSRTSSTYNSTACGGGGGYRTTFRARDFDVPEPNLPVALAHPAFGILRVRDQMLTADQGVLIEMFDRDLEPSRMDWWSRPLDAGYDNIATTAVTRHGLTVEGALGFFLSGPAFEWFELAMSSRAAE